METDKNSKKKLITDPKENLKSLMNLFDVMLLGFTAIISMACAMLLYWSLYIILICAVCFIVMLVQAIAVRVRGKSIRQYLFKPLRWAVRAVLAPDLAAVFVLSSAIYASRIWLYKFRNDYYYDTLNHDRLNTLMPESIPEDAECYSYSMMPSMLQGTGLFSVCYKTSAENIADYRTAAERESIMTFPLEEYLSGKSSFDTAHKEEIQALGKSEQAEVCIWYDDEFWAECGNAQAYLLCSNFDFNHAHSAAVIIDEERGMVQFTQFG